MIAGMIAILMFGLLIAAVIGAWYLR